MGLFDKKYCDICGDKIGLLGNRKLEDGNMCKDCAKKLSPFFFLHHKRLVIHNAWLGYPFRHRVDAGGSKCISCFLVDTRYARKDTYRFDSNILFEALFPKGRKNTWNFEGYV